MCGNYSLTGMVFKKVFLTLLVCILLCETYGQDDDCAPNGFQIISLSANATLSWEMDPDEPCEITEFQVDIHNNDSEYEYHFKVSVNHVDVSFLDICQQWSFTVIPISHGVIGFGRTLTEYIPLPPEADLSLKYFNATLLDDRDVILEWDLNNHTHGDCSLYYRLTVEDEELEIIQDVYVQGYSLHLSFLSPCVPYQLGVRAVNRATPNVEGPNLLTEVEIPAKPQETPTLQSIDIEATSVNMSWALERGTNRCPVRALYIDAGSYFNISIPVENSLDPEPVSVELKSLRPNSMYFLRVYVENSAGPSTAAQIAVQTLDLSPN